MQAVSAIAGFHFFHDSPSGRDGLLAANDDVRTGVVRQSLNDPGIVEQSITSGRVPHADNHPVWRNGAVGADNGLGLIIIGKIAGLDVFYGAIVDGRPRPGTSRQGRKTDHSGHKTEDSYTPLMPHLRIPSLQGLADHSEIFSP